MYIINKKEHHTMISKVFILCLGLMLSCNIYADKGKKATQEALNTEISNRQAADIDLQNQIDNIPLPAIYEIGDVGPAGGWVFYVNEDGLHGLEAAPEDQAVHSPWYNEVNTHTEAHGDGV